MGTWRAERGSRRRAASRLAALALAAAAAGCFEEPVEESLHLCFLADGTLVVTGSTRVNEVPGADGNPSLRRRLADVRRSLESGDDEWRRRFRALAPAVERLVLDRRGGETYELRRSGAGIEPDGVRELFAEEGIPAYFEVRNGRAELGLSPGPSSRATLEQRKRVQAALAMWSEQLAGYLADAAALYRYLEERPGRARACFSVLFSNVTRSRGEELDETEGALVAAVDAAIDKAVKVLEVGESDVYTVNELSHLVYDPFPGRVAVHLSLPPEDVEGFHDGGGGTFTVPGLGFWEAFELLEGRWLSPDPMLAVVRAHRDRSQRFDLEGFVALPRSTTEPPDPGEVRSAVEAWLSPAPRYRLAWPQAEPEEGADGETFSWDTVRCP